MSYKLVDVFPHEMLLTEKKGPCVSLYQPTYRQLPDREQNMIRFKQLLQQVENSLNKRYEKKEIEAVLKPFHEIIQNRDFWRYIKDGLAIFAAEGKCIVYKVQRPVKEFSVVANSFHIKPLIRVYQSADRYHLLGLNRKEFSMFEGTRYNLEKLKMNDTINHTFEKAIGEDFDDKIINATGGGPNNEMKVHGQGSRKDVIHRETKKFFRVVDNEVIKHFTHPTQLPVFLVALDEHHATFQELSKNKLLRKQGIKVDYQSINLAQLQAAAWEILEPLYINKTHELIDQFENARARDRGSDDITQIARAATEGRITRVLIESDRIYPGKVDIETGELSTAELNNPEIDDALDDIAEIVFRQKGEVVVIPKERMPSDTGAAAIYRY